jgi:hypothetical protein
LLSFLLTRQGGEGRVEASPEDNMTKAQKPTPQPPALKLPISDMLTAEELHQAVLRAVLLRQGITDPDTFMAENDVQSAVTYRDIPLADGRMVMMPSIAISKVAPKLPPQPQTQPESGQTGE